MVRRKNGNVYANFPPLSGGFKMVEDASGSRLKVARVAATDNGFLANLVNDSGDGTSKIVQVPGERSSDEQGKPNRIAELADLNSFFRKEGKRVAKIHSMSGSDECLAFCVELKDAAKKRTTVNNDEGNKKRAATNIESAMKGETTVASKRSRR